MGQEKTELEGHQKHEMDRLVGLAWAVGTEQIFTQLFQLIHAENISVDYQVWLLFEIITSYCCVFNK